MTLWAGASRSVLLWIGGTTLCWAQEEAPRTLQYSQHDLSVNHSALGQVVMDRVVAIVGDRVLTASDVRIEAVLAERDPSPIPMLREASTDPLQALIDLALIRHKAGDIALYQPSSSEVRSRLQLLRSSWTDPRDYDRFLQTYQLDEDSLEGMLFSRMVAENFVHRQVLLGSEGTSESPVLLTEKYQEWLDLLRSEISWRVVPPLEQLE